MRELHPHQVKNRDGLIAALAKYGSALDASETGTGKTITFLAVCQKLNAQPCIITRKPVIDAWERECAAMGVKPFFITNYEAARSGNFPWLTLEKKKSVKYNGEVSHWTNLVWTVPAGRYLFCFDEVQACRGQGTQNSKMLLAAARKYKTVLLSATPFTNPQEAGAIGPALRLFAEDRWFPWLYQHGVRKDQFGHMRFVGLGRTERAKAEGLRHMQRIHEELFPAHGVRTTRYEIPNFPDELTEVLAVEPDSLTSIEQAYACLIAIARTEDYRRACEGVAPDLLDLVQPLPITVALRARQEAELQKVGPMVELAIDARDKGESCALFVNFDHTVEALMQRLDTKCVVRGEAGDGRGNIIRANAVQSFQTNTEPFIIVNNAAGGAGISLHDPKTRKPRTCLISPPWSAIVLKQVLGRTQRLGGGFSTRKLLFAKGTVEERVMERVQASINCLDTLTDGDLDLAQKVTE